MDMISKKELLAKTGISYGQLYRWKRERLIPEEWFVKQSSYTGQETFFPKEKVLDRVTAIMELKDAHSLEELAKIFDPKVSVSVNKDQLDAIEEIDENVRLLLSSIEKERYTLLDISLFALASEVAKEESLSAEETKELLENIRSMDRGSVNAESTATFFKADGPVHVVFCSSGASVAFDKGVTVVTKKVVGENINKLRVAYSALFQGE